MSDTRTKNYVIVTASELSNADSTIDFSQLPYESTKKLRYSVDGSKAVIKYYDSKPSFFNSKTIYNYDEIKVIINNSDWIDYDEIAALIETHT